MSAHIEKVIVSRDGDIGGLASLIRAGPLLFTTARDGHRDAGTMAVVPDLAGEAEAQCEIAYGGIAELLRRAGCGPEAVVRLDHVTSSQDWLPRRQSVRQKYFGRPAPLASTGVAARMGGINMLSACAIAVTVPSEKEVLVPGPKYGMHNISSLVRGGPFLFVSGIRGTVDPRNGRVQPEETPEAFAAQTQTAYAIIAAILGEAGVDTNRILRIDSYVRDVGRARDEDAACAAVVPGLRCAKTLVGLPLGARGEVEITALALAPGQETSVARTALDDGHTVAVAAAGYVFVGDCRASSPKAGDREGQLRAALDALESALRSAGSALSRTVRLDLYLRDIHFAPAARDLLRRRFGGSPPVLFVVGAELDDLLEVKLAAIALQGG